MSKFFYGLLQLMRPLEWSKSFGNMAIAAVTVGLFLHIGLDPIRFIWGFASVALLWSGLYALNDYTDRKADAMHPVKKLRAIPSGKVSANASLVFSILLVFISLSISWFIDCAGLFTICILAMLANQLMYTMPPFNLKKRPVVDLISGSLVNPIFRFYAGWVLFVPAFNAPLSLLLFILGVQFGGFGLYRMSSKVHEKKIGLKSSVVLFGEKNMKRLAYASLAIGALSYVYTCLTVLPTIYLFLGIAMILALPLYKTALKDPQKIDMGKMYWVTYAQYLVFIAGFIVIYLLQLPL